MVLGRPPSPLLVMNSRPLNCNLDVPQFHESLFSLCDGEGEPRMILPDPHRIAAIGTAQMTHEPFRFEPFFQSYPIERDFLISRLATGRVPTSIPAFTMHWRNRSLRPRAAWYRPRNTNHAAA